MAVTKPSKQIPVVISCQRSRRDFLFMVKLFFGLLVAFSLTSCAAVLSGQKGPANAYQKTKPAPGQPAREMRTGYLVADILLVAIVVPIVVDFATFKIYRTEPKAGK